MAFEWTENISVGAPANAAGLNEMQDNLDSIYGDLSIKRNSCGSGAGWTEFPIEGGLVISKLTDQAQELRAVTDYAHDNKCPAHDSGYQSGVDASDNTDYNNGDRVGVDSSHYPGYYSDQHATHYLNHLSGVLVNDFPGYYSNQHSTYYLGHNFTVT